MLSFCLIFQDKLPLNPDGNPGQTPDLAFNTAISFLVNCNLQHYSGESGLDLFHPIICYHLSAICKCCNRYCCIDSFIQWIERKDNQKPRQLLELSCKIYYKNIIAVINYRCHHTWRLTVHRPVMMVKTVL